jgi:hypothetical protein
MAFLRNLPSALSHSPKRYFPPCASASVGALWIMADDTQPAVLEERRGDIEFRVVNNDGSHDSFIVLTGLKCIFQKQLPKMPKDYIARLVYDRSHLSIAIVKHPLEVVGYVSVPTQLVERR